MIGAFFGDTHGNVKLMYQMALDWQERTGITLDMLFQVGDFGIFPDENSVDISTRRHAEKHGYSLKEAMGDFPEILQGEYEIPIPTYFIRGNHEHQEYLLDLEKEHTEKHGIHALELPIEICPNLFYVPDAHIIEIEGIKFAGWGGCFGKKCWEENMGYWSPERINPNQAGIARRLNHMTRDRFERLMREDFQVLVTHDVPIGSGVHGMPYVDKTLPADEITQGQEGGIGFPAIRQLIDTVRPRLHFAGHFHEFHKNQLGKTTSFVLDKVHPGTDKHCMEVIEI